MMNKAITIERKSETIFHVSTNYAFWSNGDHVSEDVALAGDVLSNMAAQSAQRKLGIRYMLIAPFAVRREEIVAAARTMAVGSILTFNA